MVNCCGNLGRGGGGGPVVSVLASYYDNPSLHPLKPTVFLLKIVF